MIYSFAIAATLAKLTGFGGLWVLFSGLLACILDGIIDAGHRGRRRSAVTHSVASTPVPLLAAVIVAKFVLLPHVEPTAFYVGLILFISCLGHLFWDSLTLNGVHVPGVGWVSLANLESSGWVANAMPVLAAIVIIFLFWYGSPP